MTGDSSVTFGTGRTLSLYDEENLSGNSTVQGVKLLKAVGAGSFYFDGATLQSTGDKAFDLTVWKLSNAMTGNTAVKELNLTKEGGYDVEVEATGASGNTVTVTGTETVPYRTGDIYGGYASTGFDYDSWDLVGAEKTVTISQAIDGGKTSFGRVLGGWDTEGGASGNSLDLTNVEVTGDVVGGYSESGDATDNMVVVSDVVKVSGNIYGDYVGSGEGNAINNTVTLKGNADVSASNIYGGNTADITGNTLTIDGWSGQVGSLNNFDTINLDHIAIGTAPVIQTIGTEDSNISDAALNVGSVHVQSGVDIAVGDSIVMISGGNLTVGGNSQNISQSIIDEIADGEQGVKRFFYHTSDDNNQITADITGIELYAGRYVDADSQTYGNTGILSLNSEFELTEIAGIRAEDGSDVAGGQVILDGATMTGGQVYGGYSSDGNASNNIVTLADNTTINGDIYGGYVGGTTGNAINNTVALAGTVDVSASNIYGGNSAAVTGNTLVISGWTGTVNSINGFETIACGNLSQNSDNTSVVAVTGTTSLAGVSLTLGDTAITSDGYHTGDIITLIQGASLSTDGVDTSAIAGRQIQVTTVQMTLSYTLSSVEDSHSVGMAIDGVTVLSGVQTIAGGVADIGTTVNSGASQAVLSGGSAVNATLNGGTQSIAQGGTATGTAINEGGVQSIAARGGATDTTINIGGTQHVSAGAIVTSTIVEGGTQELLEGAIVSGTIVNGGQQTVESGTTATGTTVNSGVQVIAEGGSAIHTTVAGGEMIVSGGATGTSVTSGNMSVVAGGSVADTRISGGTVNMFGSAISTVMTSGVEIVYGTDTGGQINGGTQTVVSGGITNETHVNGYGWQEVENGGVTNNTTANSRGIQEINNAGIANSTIISNGGFQNINAGGVASGAIVGSGGYQIISSAGQTVNTIIDNEGRQTVSNGGSALSSTIQERGRQYILSGGEVYDTTINIGGIQNIEVGGSAIDTVIGIGGIQTVYGRDTGAQIDGGTQSVAVGGTATSVVINSSGVQDIAGTAIDTTINTSGTQHVSAGANVTGTVVAGGTQEMLEGASVSGTVVNAGQQKVDEGATAISTIVNNGGSQMVAGTSIDAMVNSGGIQNLLVGAVVSDTQVQSGGVQNIGDGAVAYGTTVSSGCVQNISTGGASVSTVVRAYGSQHIYSGGVSIDSIIDGGAVQQLDEGAIAYDAQISNGGIQNIGSGVTANNVLIGQGGSQIIGDGGSAVSATVNSGGVQVVSAGGIAQDTSITGGIQTVHSGAAVIGTQVSDSGIQNVLAGATVISSIITSGSRLSVIGGNNITTVARDTTISDGGILTIKGGPIIAENLHVEHATIAIQSFYAISCPTGSINLINGEGLITGDNTFDVRSGIAVGTAGKGTVRIYDINVSDANNQISLTAGTAYADAGSYTGYGKSLGGTASITRSGSSAVAGQYSADGYDANSNTVILTKEIVSGTSIDIIGGKGFTAASVNKVSITGGSTRARVVGGMATSPEGTATGNAVTLNDASITGSVYGGIVDGQTYNGTNTVNTTGTIKVSGAVAGFNTLNVKSGILTAATVNGNTANIGTSTSTIGALNISRGADVLQNLVVNAGGTTIVSGTSADGYTIGSVANKGTLNIKGGVLDIGSLGNTLTAVKTAIKDSKGRVSGYKLVQYGIGNISGGTVTADSLSNNSTFNITGGTTTIEGTLTNTGTSVSVPVLAAVKDKKGNITGYKQTGTKATAYGTLNISGGMTTAAGLNNSGTLNLKGGTLKVTDEAVNSMILNVTDGTMVIDRILTNTGTVNISGGEISLGSLTGGAGKVNITSGILASDITADSGAITLGTATKTAIKNSKGVITGYKTTYSGTGTLVASTIGEGSRLTLNRGTLSTYTDQVFTNGLGLGGYETEAGSLRSGITYAGGKANVTVAFNDAWYNEDYVRSATAAAGTKTALRFDGTLVSDNGRVADTMGIQNLSGTNVTLARVSLATAQGKDLLITSDGGTETGAETVSGHIGGQTVNLNGGDTVTVADGQSLTLTGDGKALIKGTDKATVNVEQGAVLNLGSDTVAQGGTLNNSGTVNTAGAAYTLQTYKGTEDSLLNIGNSDTADTASIASADLNGGTIFLDPAWKDGELISGAAQITVAAGVQASTLQAAASADDAVQNHLSLVNTVNQNGAPQLHAEGADLWVDMLYADGDGSGMKAGVNRTGYNNRYNGIILGSDYTWRQDKDTATRVGVAASFGKGDTSSRGDFAHTKNDYDTYGVTLYGGWTSGSFNITGTLGWHHQENDLDQYTSLGRLKVDVDSDILSAGIRGEYRFTTDTVDITPHIGLRYIHLKTDGFSTETKGGDNVFKTSDSSQNLWQIPVGVAFAKDWTTTSGWSVRPNVDFSVIPTAGDKNTVTRVGVRGIDASDSMSAEIIDNLSWRTTLGIDIQKDNVSFGLGASY